MQEYVFGFDFFFLLEKESPLNIHASQEYRETLMRLIYFKLNYEYERTVNIGREKREKERKEDVTHSVLARNGLIGFMLLCSVNPS